MAAETLLRESLFDSSRPFVALAPGSAWGTKRWPFYPELAVKLAEQANVVVVGGPSEAVTGDTIVAQLPKGAGSNAAGRLGILASAALIGQAAALVSNDSAPQHLASAMNTPTVCIFGPTVPEFGFGPLANNSAIAASKRSRAGRATGTGRNAVRLDIGAACAKFPRAMSSAF